MSQSRSRSRSPAPRAQSRSRSPERRARSASRSRSRSPRRTERPSREAEAQEGNKLFVGNIGFDMTEKDLEDMCDKYGKVVEARLATDRFTRKPQGFAFVTMESASDADKCVAELDGKEVDGRPLTVQISHGKGGRRRDDRLGGGSRMDDARATGACFDFVSGRCSRGDSCKFKHIDPRGGGRDRGYDRDRDRDYDRRDRDRYDDRRRSPRRDRDYGRDRDSRDYGRDRDSRDHGRDRRDRGGSRDYGRDRSRSRDRDYRR